MRITAIRSLVLLSGLLGSLLPPLRGLALAGVPADRTDPPTCPGGSTYYARSSAGDTVESVRPHPEPELVITVGPLEEAGPVAEEPLPSPPPLVAADDMPPAPAPAPPSMSSQDVTRALEGPPAPPAPLPPDDTEAPLDGSQDVERGITREARAELVAGGVPGAVTMIPGDIAMETGVFLPTAVAAHLVGKCRSWELQSQRCLTEMRECKEAPALSRGWLIGGGLGALALGIGIGLLAH